jgi:hypothetical protein
MTKYILHGGFSRSVSNELNDSFLQELTKGIPDKSNILKDFEWKVIER